MENELISDLGTSISGLINVDFVVVTIAQRVKVGTTIRGFTRIEVGNEGDIGITASFIRSECINISDISLRSSSSARSLTMRRGLEEDCNREEERDQDQRSHFVTKMKRERKVTKIKLFMKL